MSSSEQKSEPVSPGFWKECAKCWRQLPDKLIFFGLLAAWFLLFHFLGNSTLGYVNTPSIFGWWFWVYTGGRDIASAAKSISEILSMDEAHAWFIPLVVLGLLWMKRRELSSLPKQIWWPALGLLTLALLFHVLGFMVQQTRISLLAFFAGIYALTGLVWGRAWFRATFFPFFLIIFCVPVGTSVEYITFPLRLLATNMTVFVVHGILGIDVVQNGTAIWEPTGRFQYEVAAACSGIRSLTAIFSLAAMYAFLEFRKGWKRLVILAASFPLAVIGNVIRLVTIIIASETFGQSAGNYVHESAWFSLLPYLPVMVGLMLLGHWLRKVEPGPLQHLEVRTA